MPNTRSTVLRILLKCLLDRLKQGLTEAGLLIQPGQVSIMDASVIAAKQSRPHKGADGMTVNV